MSGGTLHIVGTPIGHLDDVSRRVIETLRGIAVCYAEDTRRTGRLMQRLGLEVPLRSLHEHNERAREAEILERLRAGQDVALVSDAGTPTVSDPGRRIVAAALENGQRVSPVPGASAVSAAVSVSGLPADRYLFAGFPPRKGQERDRWIAWVGSEEVTTVAFEAPGRLGRLLADLKAAGLGDRPAVVCRELTKLHEEIRRGTIRELAAVYEERKVRGEVTVVLGGETAGDGPVASEADLRRAVDEMRASGVDRREMAHRLRTRFGLSRNAAYRWSLGDGDDAVTD